MKLSLDNIRLDGGTQPRAELRLDTINEYAEAMKAGAKFPPVVVFYDGTEYWLADGFHRLRAWGQTFRGEEIETDLRQGTQADAQWFSYGANKEHDTAGTRRKRGDIERAVLAALRHPRSTGLSNELIAQHVGCSEKTVDRHAAKLRESTRDSVPSQRPTLRTGKDGRTINTANIGKGRNGKSRSSGRGSSLKPLKPIRGLSSPCPMIQMQFSPNNPQTAAATLWQLFPRTFVEQLIQELSHRLTQGETQ